MKILIPVDGSEHARRAVTYFFDYRAFFGLNSLITLMYAQPSVARLVAASVRSEVIEEHNAEAMEAAMGWARKRFADSRVPFEQALAFGDSAASIIDVARKGSFDLIIMGSRGHGTVPGMVIGSTTFKVLGGCKIPVLVVR